MPVNVQNSKGLWVPAIPLPWFLMFHRYRCKCGKVFFKGASYRGHYALTHILDLE